MRPHYTASCVSKLRRDWWEGWRHLVGIAGPRGPAWGRDLSQASIVARLIPAITLYNRRFGRIALRELACGRLSGEEGGREGNAARQPIDPVLGQVRTSECDTSAACPHVDIIPIPHINSARVLQKHFNFVLLGN